MSNNSKEFFVQIYKGGLTRKVIALGGIVIKLAKPDDGVILKNNHGIRANLTEARLSSKYPDKLCPVLWCSGSGKILMMRRAKPISDHLFQELNVTDFRQGLPIEKKQSSFGILDGRVVAIDYGG